MAKSSVFENRFCEIHMHIAYISFSIYLGEVAKIVESSVHTNGFY